MTLALVWLRFETKNQRSNILLLTEFKIGLFRQGNSKAMVHSLYVPTSTYFWCILGCTIWSHRVQMNYDYNNWTQEIFSSEKFLEMTMILVKMTKIVGFCCWQLLDRFRWPAHRWKDLADFFSLFVRVVNIFPAVDFIQIGWVVKTVEWFYKNDLLLIAYLLCICFKNCAITSYR